MIPVIQMYGTEWTTRNYFVVHFKQNFSYLYLFTIIIVNRTTLDYCVIKKFITSFLDLLFQHISLDLVSMQFIRQFYVSM